MKRKQIHKFLGCLLSLALLVQVLPSMGLQITWPVAAEGASSEPEHLTEVPEGYTGIYTKEDLDAIRNDLAGKYILMNDIVFTEADFAEGGAYYNDGQGWEPIGSKMKAFTGFFDGNGYKISNIYMRQRGIPVGLFGVSKGIIQNLGIIGGEIDSYSTTIDGTGSIVGDNSGSVVNCYNTGRVMGQSYWLGGIVGVNQNGGTISNCFNTGNVSGKSYTGGITGGNGVHSSVVDSYNIGNINGYSYTGGIAGSNNNTISCCYNVGTISGSSVGGIIGHGSEGVISNCYNIGNINGTSSSGGIVNYNNGSSIIRNCYNIGGIGGSKIGGIASYNSSMISNCYYLDFADKGVSTGEDTAVKCTMDEIKTQKTYSGFDFDSIWQLSGYEDYPFPTLKEVIHTEVENTTEFAGGDGTALKPYKITTSSHLTNVRKYPYANFLLINDIVFDKLDFAEGGAFYNDGLGWEPICMDKDTAFGGNFDGNGYSVQNLYTVGRTGCIGLFGYNKGTIQNLGIVDGDISIRAGSSGQIGGVVGNNMGVIVHCYNTNDIDNGSYAGGIAGYNVGIIADCYNSGEIFYLNDFAFNSKTGGIAGYNNGTITGCYNMGSVRNDETESQVGGVVV